MRERIINLVVILIVLLVGILGTLYFVNKDKGVQKTGKYQNVTIEESNSIGMLRRKLYSGKFDSGTE